MRRIRALLLLSFATLGGIALFVSRSDATPGTVRIVVPGVWFREGDMDAGKKLENLQASVKLPEVVSPWVGEALLKRQIKDAYDEISQGEPRGDLPH